MPGRIASVPIHMLHGLDGITTEHDRPINWHNSTTEMGYSKAHNVLLISGLRQALGVNIADAKTQMPAFWLSIGFRSIR